MNVKGPLKAKQLILDARMSNFINFLRTQRISVSLIVTQVSARMIAQSLCIQSFEASIAWAQKFPRGNGIPSSVKFRGQATAKLSE